MEKCIEIIVGINPSSYSLVNILLHALLLSLVTVFAIPVAGTVAEWIVNRIFRKILAGIFGSRAEYIFSNYMLCVGVIIHELSHAAFAWISGAKITEIALFKPEGGTLGHVAFRPRGNKLVQAFQNCFSACAPVVIGALLEVLLIQRVCPLLSGTWQWAIVIYVIVAVAFHMNMSTVDLQCYFRGILPVFLLMFLASSIYFLII